jgi:DNA segregation ATPase FtsK/SpoIIIE-like protein
MLFKEPDRPDSTRLQGAFMKPEGIKVLVQQLNARPQDEGNKFEIDPDELQQCDTWVNEGSSITTSRSNKELAHIILWVLVNEKVSTSRLKKAFPMGNRADDIMEKLRLIGIVTEKFSNQPRKVIPQSVDEVPADVMEFLAQNGVTAADVAEAIANRC